MITRKLELEAVCAVLSCNPKKFGIVDKELRM